MSRTPFAFIRSIAIAGAIAITAACTMPTSAAGGCEAGADKGHSIAGLDQVTLCITSGKTVRAFTVEVARTTQQQATGMMNRTEMGDDTGMIFPFDRPRPASFWMKNTILSLDLLFVKEDGTVESIAENAVPYSTDSMASEGTVASVLELRGGLTSELGIKAGDKVAWQ